MSKEAMKLALEALEYIDLVDNDRDFLQQHECYMLDEAITALREALAEQPAQQEPAAKHYANGGHLVYPTAQRPWVGLTHEDIVIILNNDYGGSRADCIRAAEARLKEKNT